jgi:hypothetical protein
MKMKQGKRKVREYNLERMVQEDFLEEVALEQRPFAGKWMELENIILSEVSLAQKTKNCMFSLICGH